MDKDGEIVDVLKRIEKILIRIEEKLSKREYTEISELDSVLLLELPDNLRKTLIELIKLKEATADEIASITGRGRAIESHYLNILMKMGYIKKRREGRKVIYYRVEV